MPWTTTVPPGQEVGDLAVLGQLDLGGALGGDLHRVALCVGEVDGVPVDDLDRARGELLVLWSWPCAVPLPRTRPVCPPRPVHRPCRNRRRHRNRRGPRSHRPAALRSPRLRRRRPPCPCRRRCRCRCRGPSGTRPRRRRRAPRRSRRPGRASSQGIRRRGGAASSALMSLASGGLASTTSGGATNDCGTAGSRRLVVRPDVTGPDQVASVSPMSSFISLALTHGGGRRSGRSEAARLAG